MWLPARLVPAPALFCVSGMLTGRKNLNGMSQNVAVAQREKKLIKVDNLSSPWRKALPGATQVRPASLPSFIFCPSFIYLSSCISDRPISLRSTTYACRQRREEERGFRDAFSRKIAAVRQWRCTHRGTAHAACIICRTSACHQMWHQRPLVTWIALGLPIQPASIKTRRWMSAPPEKICKPQSFASRQWERLSLPVWVIK